MEVKATFLGILGIGAVDNTGNVTERTGEAVAIVDATEEEQTDEGVGEGWEATVSGASGGASSVSSSAMN